MHGSTIVTSVCRKGLGRIHYFHALKVTGMKTGFPLLLIMMLFLAGCAKNEDFVNPEYMCECGTITWQGEEYPLLMAEYTQPDDDNILSRRYFLTADIRLEGETEAHNLNIQLGTDSVDQVVQFIPEDEVFNYFEEVNQNDELLPVRTYTCTNGVVNFSPAFLGGTESVSFEMVLRETVNGQPVGFDISFKGNFSVEIQ